MSCLGNYEADELMDLKASSVAILARFYGVSADYLLGLNETKK